jgi:DNA-binding NtrC family response regulator
MSASAQAWSSHRRRARTSRGIGIRILLVDDEAGFRTTLAANLELDGFDVAEAESGERALELLDHGEFDVVLTDIRMSGMNGGDLFREIERRGLHIPVVLTTAFTLEEVVRGALREGAFTVLPDRAHVADVVATLTRAARRPLVLFVDDPSARSDVLVASLNAKSLRAGVAVDHESALALAAGGEVDVCVVDLSALGVDVVDEIRAIAPDMAVVALANRDATVGGKS